MKTLLEELKYLTIAIVVVGWIIVWMIAEPNFDNKIIGINLESGSVMIPSVFMLAFAIVVNFGKDFISSKTLLHSIIAGLLVTAYAVTWYMGANAYSYLAVDGAYYKTLNAPLKHYTWEEFDSYAIETDVSNENFQPDDFDLALRVKLKDGKDFSLRETVDLDDDVSDGSVDAFEDELMVVELLEKNGIRNKDNELDVDADDFEAVERVFSKDTLERYLKLTAESLPASK